MPTYDYRCKSCGVELEIFQSITERAKRKCPECGQSALERRIGTGAGFLFKGSGFYQTDYRSESYSKGARAESKAGSKGEADNKGEANKGEANKGEANKGEANKGEANKGEAKKGGADKGASGESSGKKARPSGDGA